MKRWQIVNLSFVTTIEPDVVDEAGVCIEPEVGYWTGCRQLSHIICLLRLCTIKSTKLWNKL